jgi:hypothetical protein
LARFVLEQSGWRSIAKDLPIAIPHSEGTPYQRIVRRRITPPSAEGSDLVVVAVNGGASVGKSTFVNWYPSLATNGGATSLAAILSPTGPRPGLTRRVLIVIPKDSGDLFERRMADLRARFPKMQSMSSPDELLQPGEPLFVFVDGLESARNVVLLDSPDINTGSIFDDGPPVNLKSAQDALVAADVVNVIMDDSNIRDLNLNRSIADNLKDFGYVQSIILVRTDASSEAEFAETRTEIDDFARRVYGLEKGGQAPSAVIGRYAVLKDQAVKRGERPTLVDFSAKRKPYDHLVSRVSKLSASVRMASSRAAAEAFAKPVMTEFEVFKQRYAARVIYEEVLLGFLGTTPGAVRFPYNANPSEWRKRFKEQGDALSQFNDDAAHVASKVGRAIQAEILRRIDHPQGSAASFEDISKRTNEQIRERWVSHVNNALRELAVGRMTFSTEVSDRVVAQIETRLGTLMGQYRPQVTSVGDQNVVHLPSIENLGPEGESLRAILALQSESIFEEPTKSPKTAPGPLNDETLSLGLNGIAKDAYSGRLKLRDFVANLSSNVAGYGLPSAGLYKAGGALIAATAGPVVLGATAAGLGLAAATYVRSQLGERIDQNLAPLLNEWFEKLQEKAFGVAISDLFKATLVDLDARKLDKQKSAFLRITSELNGLGAFEKK